MSRRNRSQTPVTTEGGTDAAATPEGNGMTHTAAGKKRPTYASFICTGINKTTGVTEVLNVSGNRVRHAKWWDMVRGMVLSNYHGVMVYKARTVSEKGVAANV